MPSRASTSGKPRSRTATKNAGGTRRRPTAARKTRAAAAPTPVAPPLELPSEPAPPQLMAPAAASAPTPPRRSGSTAAWASVIGVGLVLALIAFGVPAIANGDGNHGTIKVHDEEEASPPQRNEPHVDCEDFWIEGFNMADGSGELVFYSWPPTGDKSEVMRTDWSADAHDHEKGGFHFLEGPFMLEAGHYRVEAFSDGGHPGNEQHFAKAKMFWVEPCDMSQEVSCPTNLVAAAAEDGGFMITWELAEGSDGSNVYRAEGDGDFEFIAFVAAPGDSYHDEDVEMGITYTYTVTGVFGDRESTNCAEVAISMIPDFPTVLAMGSATIVGVLGYAYATRRRN